MNLAAYFAVLSVAAALIPQSSIPVYFIGLSAAGCISETRKKSKETQDRADRQLAYFNNLHNCVHKP